MYANSIPVKTATRGNLRQRITDDLIIELEYTAVNALKEEYQFESSAIGEDDKMPTTEKIHRQRQAMFIFVGGIIVVKVLAAIV